MINMTRRITCSVWDDSSGEYLGPTQARAARAAELIIPDTHGIRTCSYTAVLGGYWQSLVIFFSIRKESTSERHLSMVTLQK